jgi:glycosyltransferase involved in cell wall biosynthesis
MKIAAVTGVKNEADIIESFIRHNQKFIDEFYIIDDSIDGTREILASLANEGVPIVLLNVDTRDYL